MTKSNGLEIAAFAALLVCTRRKRVRNSDHCRNAAVRESVSAN